MRRRIFDFYHRHLARYAGGVPMWLQGELAGLAYKISRHPDFGFFHARALIASGHNTRATRLYSTGQTPSDPLFQASLSPLPQMPDKPLAKGVFQVQIGYHGLRLSGEICAETAHPDPEKIMLYLGGTLLRAEKLGFHQGKAQFRCRISRDILDQFPPQAILRAQTPDGRVLPTPVGGPGWQVSMPHGQGGIDTAIAQFGAMEKKGHLRPDPQMLATRQAGYLALYRDLRMVFEREFNRPLLILYGTLLGQVRSEDFIPGDDDFDVGYPSHATTFDAVRAEAIQIIERLADLGYVIVLNETGRPFRIRAADGDVWCHLDNRPIFAPGDGYIWLHKQARLAVDLSDFQHGEEATLRGQTVIRPENPDRFLAAYYGPNWRIPDPGYSNAAGGIPRQITQGLARICLTHAEQKKLARAYPGKVVPERYQPLYPLDIYGKTIGF